MAGNKHACYAGRVAALTAALFLSSIAAADADLAASLRAVIHPLPDGSPKQTLQSFIRRTGLPVIIRGSAPVRDYPYRTDGVQAGDVLEDMCEFYGYAWRRASDWCVLEALPGSPDGENAALIRWLRDNEHLIELSLEQATRLSLYGQEVLTTLSTRYPMLRKIRRDDWVSLRFLASLDSDQRTFMQRQGLAVSSLRESQLAQLDAALRARGMQLQAPNEYRLRLTEGQSRGNTRTRSLTISRQGESIRLLSFAGSGTGDVPPAPGARIRSGWLKMVSGGLIELDIQNWKAGELIDALAKQSGQQFQTTAELRDISVSIIAPPRTIEQVREGLAAAFGAVWSERDGQWLLSEDAEAKESIARRIAEYTAASIWTADDFINELLSRLPDQDRELQKIVASDPDMYDQLNRRGTIRYAVEAYAALPIAAKTAIKKNGRWKGNCSSLSGKCREALSRSMSFLTAGGRPVIDAREIAAPGATVQFARQADLIVVTIRTPTQPNGLSQKFGRGASARHPPPEHLGIRPWYMGFPRTIPSSYVAHLDDVREWRGGLGLRHIAPLAFIPDMARKKLKDQVPEMERIGRSNEEFLILYSVLNPDQRRMLWTTEGIGLKGLHPGAYFALLGIAGWPQANFSRESYRALRVMLYRDPEAPELDCEFRCKIAGRMLRGSLAVAKPANRS